MIRNTLDSSIVEFADSLPAEVSIVENDHLENMLFDRNLMNLEFRRACLDCTTSFVGHLRDELGGSDVSELMILSKGIAYQLSAAFATVLDQNLPLNLISTTRSAVDGEDVSISISYKRFDAGGDTLIVGDTVASGATMIAALRAYRSSHRLKRVYLLSYAGTMVGAGRIISFCKELGIEIRIVYGLAAFGLGRNGFDLSFLHPETVTAMRHRERASKQFDGKPVSAVGWDFGSQFLAPIKYQNLCWAEARFWGLQDHPSLAQARRPEDLSVLDGERNAFERPSDSTDRSLEHF